METWRLHASENQHEAGANAIRSRWQSGPGEPLPISAPPLLVKQLACQSWSWRKCLPSTTRGVTHGVWRQDPLALSCPGRMGGSKKRYRVRLRHLLSFPFPERFEKIAATWVTKKPTSCWIVRKNAKNVSLATGSMQSWQKLCYQFWNTEYSISYSAPIRALHATEVEENEKRIEAMFVFPISCLSSV